MAFQTVDSELPRDTWGRPLITPPEGGAPVAYTRATTFAGTIEDTYHLGKWQARMVALGIAARRDLYLSATTLSSNDKDKKTLNALVESALEASGSKARAAIGTALHSLSERVDRGEELGENVPEEFLADLEAYRAIMVPFNVLEIEGFCVMDEIQVGGTYDRIVNLDPGALPPHPDGTPSGGNYIFDLKTGGSVELGAGKIAQQLGIYSRSVKYDHRDGSRTPLPDVSQKWGIVVHLPAGSGAATLNWFDIEAGWAAAYALSGPVRAFRSRKDLVVPFVKKTSSRRRTSIPTQIAEAETPAAVMEVWKANRTKWTPGLTSLAEARVAELKAN